MNTITIAPEFFRGEVRNYADWRKAFWRELVQNAVDAGARRIDITLEDQGEGRAKVTVADNGCGMTREVLEDVFFCLGRTTKATGDSIGGFGKARILLCYAVDEYAIATGNLRASGKGGTYQIQERDENRRGCVFAMVVPYADFGGTFESFEGALRRFLSLCHLTGQQVFVNGVQWKEWTHGSRLVRRLSFGEVFANKGGETRLANRLLVRVSGVLMFEKYLSTSAQVVVNLDPARSRDVLTSNRDGLRSEYAAELDRLCQEIAADTQSALRADRTTKQILNGEGQIWNSGFRKRGRKSHPALTVVAGGRSEVDEPVPDAGHVNEETVVSYDGSGLAMAASVGSGGSYSPHQYVSQPPPVEIDRVTSGMVFLIKTQNEGLRAAAKEYHPNRWKDGRGNRRRVLLAQWIVAVEAALDALSQVHELSAVRWRPGFVIDDTTKAQCEKQGDGSYALLLNPLVRPGEDVSDKDTGRMRFRIKDWDSHAELLTLACHEVTHLIYDWHDEAFAATFTDITGRAMAWLRELHLEMNAAG